LDTNIDKEETEVVFFIFVVCVTNSTNKKIKDKRKGDINE
jgi:hypothetical protein